MIASFLPTAQTGVGLMWAGLAAGVSATVIAMTSALRGRERDVRAPLDDDALETRWQAVLLLAVCAGAAIRLTGLGTKGLSHPEAYIPGLNLPVGLSEPPPRHAFRETLVWHFTAEPHPFGYYVVMWAWTKAFGTSLTALRLPEALAGIATIVVSYRVAALQWGRRVGVVTAAMLSLHGFHLFWSQTARMYAPGAFVGLLSSWALLAMHRPGPHRAVIGMAYVVATVTGMMTVEFFWPFLAVQMVWVALAYRATRSAQGHDALPHAAFLQAVSCILGAPLLASAVMTARNGAAAGPTFTFLRQYLSFGFLFQHGAYSETFVRAPFALEVAAFVVGVLLLLRGLRVPLATPVIDETVAPSAMRPLVVGACAMAVSLFGIGRWSDAHRVMLQLLSAMPIAALLIPLIAARVGPWLERAVGRSVAVPLLPLQALLPMVLLYLVSFKVTLLAPRAFLLFVPYLLMVIAAGAVAIARHARIAVPLAVAGVAAFAVSVSLAIRTPVSPRDYQGFAGAINERLRPTDLLFVPPRSWVITPIFYYLKTTRYVGDDYVNAVRRNPDARVWLLLPPAMRSVDLLQALASYRADSVVGGGVRALLYTPPGASRALLGNAHRGGT